MLYMSKARKDVFLWVQKGQFGSRRSKLGSIEFMWGQGGSKDDKSGRFN